MTPIPEMVDTTKYLWDYLFKVRVPQMAATSIDYMRMYGSYTTQCKEIDQTLQQQWITTMLSVSQMVDYFKEGVQIRVVQYSDIKTIYEYISDHLQAWRIRLERGINIGDAPIEDLIAMDQFANTVYEHAKHQFTREIANSLLARNMSTVTQFNRHNFFRPTLPTTTAEGVVNELTRINHDVNTVPERDSLSDFLKGRLIGSSRWQ